MIELNVEDITKIQIVRWEDGTILRYIVNDTIEVPNEEVLTAHQAVLKALETITPIDIQEDYTVLRTQGIHGYPSIGEQLDMIYRAGLGGDEFQSAISAVKQAYPKPKESN